MKRFVSMAVLASCALAAAAGQAQGFARNTTSGDAIGSIEIPVTPFANMENGYQATNPGFRAFIKSKDGRYFVAGGPLTMDAVMRGRSDDASQGSAYGRLILHMDQAVFPLRGTRAPEATSGTHQGLLSICMAADTTAPVNMTKCRDLGGAEDGRPFQWLDKEIDYTIDSNGNIAITKFYGDTGEGGTSNQLSLSTFHPAYNFAAPGKAFKDYQSPLVLDLDHNGALDLVNVWNDRTPIHFDLNGRGEKVRTGWVKGTDGLLFVDNGSGCAQTGSQFLGEYTHSKHGERTYPNGFVALQKLYDANGTGRVVMAEHPELKVWRNRAQDGICKASEVVSASSLVKEIRVGYQTVANVKLTEDNEIRLTGTYLGVDGKSHLVGDVWFKQRRHEVASN